MPFRPGAEVQSNRKKADAVAKGFRFRARKPSLTAIVTTPNAASALGAGSPSRGDPASQLKRSMLFSKLLFTWTEISGGSRRAAKRAPNATREMGGQS